MSLKDLWSIIKGTDKKVVDARANHQFSDADREHAEEMRKLRQETARIQQKMQLMEQKRELQDLKAELYDGDDDEDDDGENDVATLVSQLFGAVKSGVSQSPPTIVNPQSAAYHPKLSDNDIRSFIVKQDRKHIKLAKTMPKEIVKRKISEQIQLTDEEFERAHQILLSEF